MSQYCKSGTLNTSILSPRVCCNARSLLRIPEQCFASKLCSLKVYIGLHKFVMAKYCFGMGESNPFIIIPCSNDIVCRLWDHVTPCDIMWLPTPGVWWWVQGIHGDGDDEGRWTAGPHPGTKVLLRKRSSLCPICFGKSFDALLHLQSVCLPSSKS